MVNLFRLLYFLQKANKRLYWSKSELNRYQDKRIRSIVKYAYDTVPFYHQLYKQYGVDVAKIEKVEDLEKLPVVKKAFFKQQEPRTLVSTQYQLESLKQVRTSGSTGTPFTIYLNPEEDAWRKAIYMRANIACGQKARDRWVVLTAPTHYKDTTNIQRKLNVFAQNCVSLFEPSDVKVQQVVAAKPDVLDGYSGSVAMLAKEAIKRNITTIRPHVVFGNAEYLDPHSRQCIEEAFDAPYCDQFGCAEIDRSAWQCLERKSYHLDVDSVITEFIDEKDKPVAGGERGQVAYTSLFNYTMPFIRYAIGDIAVPDEEDTCPCGITLPLMKVVEGRKDAFLTLPGGRTFSPFIFNYAMSTFSLFRYIDQYQIHQKKVDQMDIYFKLSSSPIEQTKIAQEFSAHINKFFDLQNDDVKFNISFVAEIPLSKTGKLRSVWSDVPNQLG